MLTALIPRLLKIVIPFTIVFTTAASPAWIGQATPEPPPVESMLREVLRRSPEGIDLQITDLTIEGPWMVAGVIPASLGPSGLEGDGRHVIGLWQGQAWDVAFEGTPEFRRLLREIPDVLISATDKVWLDYENPPADAPLESITVSGYKLPWPSGVTYYVTRAWITGACSHWEDYAVDVQMPLGSAIVAMKGGTVSSVVENLTACGCSSALMNSSNYVQITHSDGTSALYAHIGQNQAVVDVNDTVAQGEVIAYSNQIGFTCGIGTTCPSGTCTLPNPADCTPFPHLHFHVTNSSGVKQYIIFDDVSGGDISGCNSYTSGNQGACCGCLVGMQSPGGLSSQNMSLLEVTALQSRPNQTELEGERDQPKDSDVAEMRSNADGHASMEWEPYIRLKPSQLAGSSAPQEAHAEVMDAVGNVPQPILASVRAVLDVDPPASANYTLAHSVVAMGGGPKTSASYRVNGSSGQLYQTGVLQSASYQVRSGYWAGITANAPAVQQSTLLLGAGWSLVTLPLDQMCIRDSSTPPVLAPT